jgi:hypothetical protein
MSTAKVVTILHPSSAVNNIVNDASGNVAVGGTLTSSTITSATATALTIKSAGTTAMTIDTSQNVGIGTSSPSAKLHTSGADIVEQLNSSTSFAAKLFVSSTTTGSGRYIAAEANDMTFGRYGVAEQMRIDSSGNLLVGTTTGGYRLHVNGGGADTVNISNATFSSGSYFIRFGVGSGAGSNVGYISYNGSGVTYSTTSDYRLKHSVTPMATGLATVSALKPVTYKWNADNSDGEGFIAHELQSVIPFAVTGDKDAVDEEGNIKPQGVDYSKIVVHLVAAIQELEARLAALEAK